VFVPGLTNYQSYKFHFKKANGEYVDKIDPYAFFSEIAPNTCSRLFDIENFIWHDNEFLNKRDRNFDKPMSIYEMHLGSWLKGDRFPSYEETADQLIPYIKGMGFNAIWISPILENLEDSYHGYHTTNFYKLNDHFGSEADFKS
jgi:1,4-alpha-glucan branching enzyme